MITKCAIAAALVAGLVSGLPASAQETKSKAEKVGDKIESKTESAKDAIERKVDKAGDKMESAKDKMTEKIQSAKGKIQAKADRAQVKNAQQALKEKGHDPGPIDGVMGPRTRAAVSDFQKAEGLPASGALDDATAVKLQVSASPRTDTTPSASPTTSPAAPPAEKSQKP